MSKDSRRAKKEQKQQDELQRMQRLGQLHKKAQRRVPKATARPCPACHGGGKLLVVSRDGSTKHKRCGTCHGRGSI